VRIFRLTRARARKAKNRRWKLASLPGRPARLAQQVEWALDGRDHAGGHTRVARCRVELVMTKESLNDADIGPTFEPWRSACSVTAFLMPRNACRRELGRIGLHGAGESVAKRLFLGIGEGGLQHDTAIVLDLLDHLVRRHLLDKHK
jgi:hypothetical protein